MLFYYWLPHATRGPTSHFQLPKFKVFMALMLWSVGYCVISTFAFNLFFAMLSKQHTIPTHASLYQLLPLALFHTLLFTVLMANAKYWPEDAAPNMFLVTASGASLIWFVLFAVRDYASVPWLIISLLLSHALFALDAYEDVLTRYNYTPLVASLTYPLVCHLPVHSVIWYVFLRGQYSWTMWMVLTCVFVLQNVISTCLQWTLAEPEIPYSDTYSVRMVLIVIVLACFPSLVLQFSIVNMNWALQFQCIGIYYVDVCGKFLIMGRTITDMSKLSTQ